MSEDLVAQNKQLRITVGKHIREAAELNSQINHLKRQLENADKTLKGALNKLNEQAASMDMAAQLMEAMSLQGEQDDRLLNRLMSELHNTFCPHHTQSLANQHTPNTHPLSNTKLYRHPFARDERN